jgi:2-polyprenyl-3-methyl-5-hydroxy-6-metoxy-1,4-benzoquinol methylase
VLFRGLPPFQRLLAHARPLICPVPPLVEAVGQPQSLLDIGCGGGAILGHLLARLSPGRALGCDINAPYVAAAARVAAAAASARPGARYEARLLPTPAVWPEESFECVILIDVLHHVPLEERRALVAGAAARVRPGGRLVIKEMDRRPWLCAMGNRLHDLVLTAEWVRYVDFPEVAAWVAAAGLRPGAFRRYRRYWYQHLLQVFHRDG